MSGGQMISLAIAAAIVFWMVGAYNRLVSLRNAIGVAWAQFEEPLLRREQVLTPLLVHLREPLAAEHSALDAVVGALAQLRSAAEAVRARPVQVAAPQAFVVQEAQLAAVLARLLALVDQQPGLRDAAEVAERVAEVQAATQRMASARQWFNDVAASYDAAIRQWPTRALVPWFGFGPAGRL
jgi:LemA protein